MAQRTTVELSSLAPTQLADIKQQLDQEIDHLGESFQKLRQAQNKFQDCADAVAKTSQPKNEDNPILIPLTSSLYVPGRMSQVDSYMVDVGTGYYVEKNAQDSIKFFNGKVATLQNNMKDLQKVVEAKVGNLRAVEAALQKKMEK